MLHTYKNTHVPMHEHTHTHPRAHTHKQAAQPFSWYGLPPSMQMTFIMQMHTNQNRPSENPGWEKTERIESNELRRGRGRGEEDAVLG